MRILQLLLFILVPIANYAGFYFWGSPFGDDPEVLIQPADYAFAIWGPIFLGMIIYSVFQLGPARKQSTHLKQATYAGILAALASITFVPISYSNLQWLSMLNILWHLVALIWLFIALKKQIGLEENRYTRWFYLPTQLYLGWISAATAVSIALFLKGTLGISPDIQIQIYLTAALVIILSALALFLNLNRGVVFALVIVWALIALIIENSSYALILYSAISGIVLVLIATAVQLKKGRPWCY